MRRALFLLRGETVVSGDAGAPNIHVQVKACSSAKYIVSYKKNNPILFCRMSYGVGTGVNEKKHILKVRKKIYP